MSDTGAGGHAFLADGGLSSPVPIVMLWSSDGIMLYSDAYSGFAGSRHPQLLGSPVLNGWPEVAVSTIM